MYASIEFTVIPKSEKKAFADRASERPMISPLLLLLLLSSLILFLAVFS